ncbi:MAG: exodeoxyribonuclease V subunit beta [Kiritimatiellae bacterium]|jgi:exodeoxyribonuclease V beta subunit|nr:exodeoxyribonuclease V subunit beta [Kiritimatiellia bacterium]
MKTLDLLQEPRKGINLIEANAGTGKTFSISHIYLWLILKGIKVENILVVTFTDAAAKELKDRCRSLIYDAMMNFKTGGDSDACKIINSFMGQGEDAKMLNLLKLAVASMDIASIFTIHGFCNKMLSEFAVETGVLFDATLVDDDKSYVERTVLNFYRRLFYDATSQELSLLNMCDVKYESLVEFSKELKKNHKLCIEGEDKLDDIDKKTIYDNHGKSFSALNKQLKTLQKQYEKYIDEAYGELRRLIESAKLKKTTYSAEKIDNIFEEFEQELNKNSAFDIEQKFLEKLSSEYIASNLKKAYADEIISCTFFDLVARFSETLSLHKDALNQSVENLKIMILMDFREFFVREFEVLKRTQNIISYDDMLELLHSALFSDVGNELAEKIAKLYDAALIDEFQDTDRMQFEIFSKLFVDKPEKYFYMIGDPKQSIYKFRGADIQMYMSAKNRADHQFTLETNYRSEKSMIEGVNQFFDVQLDDGRNSLYYHENDAGEYIQFLPSKGQDNIKWKFCCPPDDNKALTVVALSDKKSRKVLESEVAADVALRILRLLTCEDYYFEGENGERRRVKPQDIAVLANTGKQIHLIKSALQDVQVAASVQKSGNVFDSKEADAMALLLNAINSPSERTIKPLLITTLFNYSIRELRELDNKAILEIYYRFISYKQIWEEDNFFSAFLALVNDFGLIERILQDKNGDRNVANTMHLVELIHKQEYFFRTSPVATERWFVLQKTNTPDTEDSQFYLQRLEIDDEAVNVMTIHKSKGLEFPLVFVPFLSTPVVSQKARTGVYTDEQDSFKKIYAENASEQPKYVEECLQESLRLMYVALTRAANRCWTYYYKPTRSQPNSSSMQILYPDVSLLKDQFVDYLIQPMLSEIIAAAPVEPEEKILELANARFRRTDVSKLKSGIFSYSMLADWKKDALVVKDLDYMEDVADETPVVIKEDDYSFFNFPRGANTGTAVHQIFEYIFNGRIDVNNPQSFESGVANGLKSFGLHGNDEDVQNQRVAAVMEMITNVMNAKFVIPASDGESFTLKDLDHAKCKTELEFYYSLFLGSGLPAPESIEEMGGNIAFLSKLDLKGYMTGFIDLVFEYQGKYYILDWKSNHLGNSFGLYSPQLLKDEMKHAKYDIQYVVYSYALNAYLKQRLGDEYSYEKHFGGVFYTFIRGIQSGETNGIFFDKVKMDIIEWLNLR